LIELFVLQPGDFDRIVEIWKESGLSHRPKGRDQRERIAREIEGDCSVFLGARHDGTIVGVVLGTHDGRKGWINRLAVVPAWRGQGIATKLVREVERRIRAQGIEIVTCLIEDDNEDSMRFFEALGYVEHRECIYYSNRLNPDV